MFLYTYYECLFIVGFMCLIEITPGLIMEYLASNFTGIINQTEVFDLYCIKQPVGPLVWGVFSVPCSFVGLLASIWLLWVLIQRRRLGLSSYIYMFK